MNGTILVSAIAIIFILALLWFVATQILFKKSKLSLELPELPELLKLGENKKDQESPYEDHFIIDSFSLFYKNWTKSDSEDVYVLIHGIGASHYTWRFMVERFFEKGSVLAIDLAGFGASTKNPNFSHSIHDQSTLVHQMLTELVGNKNIYLVGSSMGASISMYLSCLHPDNYRKLCLISPAVAPYRARFLHIPSIFVATKMIGKHVANRSFIERLVKRTVSNQALVTSDVVDQYYAPYKENVDAMLCFVRATEIFTDAKLWDEFAHLKAECLLVWGKEDKVTPERHRKRFLKRFPKWKQAVHPKAGHHVQEDEPEWLFEKIDRFLNN